MLRSSSKSRSGYFDFGQKKSHSSSVLSRSISATRLCRGDALVSQVDKGALVSVEKNNPPKFVNLSQDKKVKGSTMQQQMGNLEEELQHTKEQLSTMEGERDRAIDELRETERVAREATMRLREALSPRKAGELLEDLATLKDALSNSKRELEMKEKDIASLKFELENAKQFEIKLFEREELFDRMNTDLGKTKGLMLESNNRILDLEAEVARGNLSESKMYESVVSQTKQLEQAKIELEESKLEITSLREQMAKLQASSKHGTTGDSDENSDSTKDAFENLKSELKLAKESLARAEEAEKLASMKAKTLLDEMEVLKNELKLATDAEEKSKKAMDDLALALKEVATESNQAKEKLSFTEVELEHVRGEAEQLKEMVRTTEDKYQKLLDETKKELELQKNTADRLRIEAEESILAWNGKEMGFVTCIKKADDEKAAVQHENLRLAESLKAAENMTRTAREESYKLRDILKQALNEANVAKEGANIAVAENSELKDNLTEKDEALHFLTRENERLRISEAAAIENIKELKRLLSAAKTDSKVEEKEHEESIFNSPQSSFHEDHHDLKKGFSFDLNELKLFDAHEDVEKAVLDEDPEKAEALKGSIFDTTVSPKSEPHTPKPSSHHRRDSSSTFTDDGNSEDFDHGSSHEGHEDDADERNAHRKKRLLRRFGDLIYRKSFHKREPSNGNGWWSGPVCAHVD